MAEKSELAGAQSLKTRQLPQVLETPSVPMSLKRLQVLFFLVLSLSTLGVHGAGDPAAGKPVAQLDLTDAIVLGVVEGVTEFLPISSTGHLIITNQLLGLESEAPLTDEKGNPLWYKPISAKHPQGIPLTLKLAADTYTVVIQAGAIIAVVIIYWQ
jgi:hypothetical protein